MPPPAACPQCTAGITAEALSCPSCHWLVHGDTLKTLAGEAECAASAGDLTAALTAWRRALDLLPPPSTQYRAVQERVAALSRQLDAAPVMAAPPPGTSVSKAPGKRRNYGVLGIIGAAFVFLLTKGKLLLAGLSKASTFFSMLLAVGVYWTVWGWWFALGFVLCIYVHEMGHVAALRRYGIPASPPMFIPGVGAFVRMKQYPATPSEDATVGLAGPLWGLGAAVVTYALFLLTGNGIFAALTHIGALINVFNLMPLGPLDGGRGFRALSRPQRWLAMLVTGAIWYFTNEGLLLLVLIMGVLRALATDAPERGDRAVLAKFVLLVAGLMLLSTLAAEAGRPLVTGNQ
jgi:Zn-dependent protease